MWHSSFVFFVFFFLNHWWWRWIQFPEFLQGEGGKKRGGKKKKEKKGKSRQRLCPQEGPIRAERAPVRQATHVILPSSNITALHRVLNPKWLIWGKKKKAAGFQEEGGRKGRGGEQHAYKRRKTKSSTIKSDHIDSLQYDKEYSRERFYCLLRLFGGKSSVRAPLLQADMLRKKK